ncbi:hypothetical protein [Actinospongicola halichondriae]|uniref:hypothetical protein n=1 Tax=Actinospongicola halichondriae TaxID=3236844 RepID=UPI003D385A8D
MGDPMVGVYLVYSAVAVGLVVWLARTLFNNGAVFLEDVFDDARLAAAVNRLLVTGFYMANLGYAAVLLRADEVDGAVEALEVLANKLGVLLLTLAAVHFANLYVFYRVRRRATAAHMPPPVAPQVFVPPPPPPADAEWQPVG